MNMRRSALMTIAISSGVAMTSALYAQAPPGEVVYNLDFDPGSPWSYGQQPPGYGDDLHLARAGDLVSFTISVYNGSSSTFVGGPGTYVPVDALVQFFAAPPSYGSLTPPGSLIAQFTVPIPAPDANDGGLGTVHTVTTNLTTPVPVPQDIWVYVTTPDAMGTFGHTYAGPALHSFPVAPDIGTTDVGCYLGLPYNYFYTGYDYRQPVTIRLSEGNQPPVITCGTPAVLWEPSHELIDISANLPAISDPDTAPEDLTVDGSVVSDEHEVPETGDGTGKHAPDFKTQLVSGANGFFLRSERRGPGDGRVYLAVVTVSDGTNTVTEVCVVGVVPHDQTAESLDQVLLEADARAAALQAEIDSVGVGSVDLAALGLSEHGVSGELGPKQ